MKIKSPAKITDFYSFPGFKARSRLKGVSGDRYARVIKLERRKKQPFVLVADTSVMEGTTSISAGQELFRRQAGGFIWSSSAGVYSARSVVPCL
jgi:hypothetical protein